MSKMARRRGRVRSRPPFALLLGILVGSGSSALGFGDPNYPVQPKPKTKGIKALLSHREAPQGTLGYGPPGPQPGVQGFGLKFGRNYGYGGGNALGVGAEGGYPFYGGPGYPHPAPQLRRIGGITAFPYFGGPGCPSPAHPNFYGQTGPLAGDQRVVTFEDSPEAPETDFGSFTGTLPYPEQTFAPFSTDGGTAANNAASNPAPLQPPPPPPPPPPTDTPPPPPGVPDVAGSGGSVGMATETALDGVNLLGLKVVKVTPGKWADQSGLMTGDVIRSANGFQTDQPGNLEWIIANAAPEKTLTLTVRTARDGALRVVSTQLR